MGQTIAEKAKAEKLRLKALKKAKALDEKFKSSTKPQKRVIVAKDVLAQLEADNIRAKVRVYLKGKTNRFVLDDSTRKKKMEMRDYLPEMGTCNVCALGSLFYSKVAINNNCKAEVEEYAGEKIVDFSDHLDYDESEDDVLRLSLEKIFSKPQLGLIETAFEGRDFMSEALDEDDVWEYRNENTDLINRTRV